MHPTHHFIPLLYEPRQSYLGKLSQQDVRSFEDFINEGKGTDLSLRTEDILTERAITGKEACSRFPGRFLS